MSAHRAFLERLYDVAVAAAHPRALVDAAIARLTEREPHAQRISLISLGKAAPAMSHAAVAGLTRLGRSVVTGMTGGANDGPAAHSAITRSTGDHPVPGPRSQHAAAALETAVRDTRDSADVALVLISGGTTSLLASPVESITQGELAALYDALLRSGWDIAAMNDVRKRFLRWGAGRLAEALAPVPIELALLSDVIGDDPRSIASGPCTPDPLLASDIQRRLNELTTLDSVTRVALDAHLARVVQGDFPETPKVDHSAFRSVSSPTVHGNATALAAAADYARTTGWEVELAPEPLRGDARTRGAELAGSLLRARRDRPLCIMRGGETTVTMPATTARPGGRCQELVLSAAEVLDGVEPDGSISMLAAGTDGRDGLTSAAGAIVDSLTWGRIRERGIDPAHALEIHDSHRALAAAGALLPARPTGTNVMDIIVGVVGDAAP